MTGKNNFNEFVNEYFGQLKMVIDMLDYDSVEKLVAAIWATYKKGAVVYFAGNGGSASIATHMAADIGKNVLNDYKNEKEKRFRTISLTDNVAWISALANDIGYEDIFVEQLKNSVNRNDMLVVISSSGNSPNVVKVAEWCQANKIKVAAMVGFSGGRIKDLADICVHVPIDNYGLVEGLHGDIHHCVIEVLKVLKREEDQVKFDALKKS